jgi:hypothetical protein
MSEAALSEIALPEIAMPQVALTEYAGRTPALVVAPQLVAKIEGHGSHGLSHLSGHFDSRVFAMCVHLYREPHQATGN